MFLLLLWLCSIASSALAAVSIPALTHPARMGPDPKLKLSSSTPLQLQTLTLHSPLLSNSTIPKINRFLSAQLLNLTERSCSYGTNTLHRSQHHCPALNRKAAALSPLLASKPLAWLCQPPPPALLSTLWPRLLQPSVTQKPPWHLVDPSSKQWALQPSPRHHQARLAAMLMHCDSAARSNGHCSTKLTVHLLLAADAGESGL